MKRIVCSLLAAASISSPAIAAPPMIAPNAAPPVNGTLRPPRPINALPSSGSAELVVMVKGFGRVHTSFGDCLNAGQGQQDCNFTVPRDARIVIQAFPATNTPQDWHLAAWGGPACSQIAGATCTFTMKQDVESVVVTFEPPGPAHYSAELGLEGGTVTVPGAIDCTRLYVRENAGPKCSAQTQTGAVQTATIKTTAGFNFTGWQLSGGLAPVACDTGVTCKFRVAGSGGKISPQFTFAEPKVGAIKVYLPIDPASGNAFYSATSPNATQAYCESKSLCEFGAPVGTRLIVKVVREITPAKINFPSAWKGCIYIDDNDDNAATSTCGYDIKQWGQQTGEIRIPAP